MFIFLKNLLEAYITRKIGNLFPITPLIFPPSYPLKWALYYARNYYAPNVIIGVKAIP